MRPGHETLVMKRRLRSFRAWLMHESGRKEDAFVQDGTSMATPNAKSGFRVSNESFLNTSSLTTRKTGGGRKFKFEYAGLIENMHGAQLQKRGKGVRVRG